MSFTVMGRMTAYPLPISLQISMSPPSSTRPFFHCACLHSSVVTLPLPRATSWATKRYTGLIVTSRSKTRPHGNTCRQDVLFCLDGR
ncbi:hypothetical protein E2C01_009041 [Portunus trituberculatus]|uniref:Uncharacterized protein n=1 Tax=Portunus trituberculatus TaxID=210409 RepID=A0A5B7D4E5_PORTR|nr:hypothetical protein [Portunus trituberculatus]